MKFKCNLCNPDKGPVQTVTAIDYDTGLSAMQNHIDIFHDGGEAMIADVTLNVKVRHG